MGGLGSASGVIGRFLMDHVRVRAEGTGSPAMAEHAPGQGGNLYLPRFDARDLPSPAPGRGFGVQIAEIATNAGKTVTMASFAEMLPRAENRVTLDPIQKDAWGIPVLRIDCGHSPAETYPSARAGLSIARNCERTRSNADRH